MSEDEQLRIRRARIEEIRPLAQEYRAEQERDPEGLPEPALPQGGIFWLAVDAEGAPLGYAAGTLRPSGCTIGPVFAREQARRRGVGEALITAVQDWARDTRVPVVEISVAADNEAGQAFLEALGYRPRRVLMSLQPDGTRRR
ncbi:MAG: GNAT family N-acetyltransferase [Nitriliruptoraceae bacterium]